MVHRLDASLAGESSVGGADGDGKVADGQQAASVGGLPRAEGRTKHSPRSDRLIERGGPGGRPDDGPAHSAPKRSALCHSPL